MTVTEESKKYLEQVKKGKPRNFAIVTKGVKIVALLVKKKPIKAGETKELKKTSKGQKVFIGVAEGQGQDITFKLKAEDTEKPPGKELMLKDFLLSQAEFKCRPSYEIVRDLEVVDDDSELDVEVTEESSDTDQTNIATQLAAYEKLVPEFVRTFENRRVEILKPVKLLKDFLGGDNSILLDQANEALATVKQLLGELEHGGAAPQPSSEADRFAQFHEEVKKQYLEYMEGEPKDASKLRAVMQFAVEKAAEENYTSATKALTNLKAAMNNVETESPELVAWGKARDAVAGQIRDVANAVAATKDPDAEPVIIQLRSILANLPPKPNAQGVIELERYIRDDDVIRAAEEVPPHFGKLVIREPLLSALEGLKT